jgi:hypothetical protein
MGTRTIKAASGMLFQKEKGHGVGAIVAEAIWRKSLILMVGATGIEPIFSPKSHPADLPKTVL